MKSLNESLRNLGLTEAQINDAFPFLKEEDEGEVDPSVNDEVTEIGYLSDDDDFEDDEVAEEDEGEDEAEEESEDKPEEESEEEESCEIVDMDIVIEGMSDDDLDAVAKDLNLEEGFIKLAPKGKRKARRLKMKKWLKTSAGHQYLAQKNRDSKKASTKKKRKIHTKKLKAHGGPKMNKMFRENIDDLRHALDHDPGEQFNTFAEAFNGIADIGELACGRLMDEDDSAAKDFAGIAMGAEAVLRRMEGMDGQVGFADRNMLEATLKEAMDVVGALIAKYKVLEDMAEGMSVDEEADVDASLSIWDSAPLVSESFLEGIRKVTGK